MISPTARIQSPLATIHGTVDEHDIVTTYDANGCMYMQLSKEVYEAMMQREHEEHERSLVVYRGPLGNLRKVER